MGKLLEKLGFGTKKHSWNDMGPEMHMEILKRIAIAPAAIALSVFAGIKSGAYSMYIVGAAIALIALGLAAYTYMVFACERYVLFIGDVCNVERKLRTTKNKTIYGRATATMAVENMFLDFPVSPRSQINKGTRCAVYTVPNGVVGKGNDYYVIPNPLAISIISQENNELFKAEKQNKKEK